MKPFLIVLLLVSCLFAAYEQPGLNTGSRNYDTIANFGADSLKYSKSFNLSGLRYLRVDVFCDDTSTAGFANDTVLFLWGLETCHLTRDSADNEDTAYSTMRFAVDTFDISGGTIAPSEILIGTDGSITEVRQVIDTASVTGLMYQTRNVSLPFDGRVRAYFQGLSGNKVNGELRLRVQFFQQTKEP